MRICTHNKLSKFRHKHVWQPQSSGRPGNEATSAQVLHSGFFLIKVIILMVLMSIAATAIIRVYLAKKIGDVYAQEEEANLEHIADGLKQYILNNRIIPDQTTWATTVANELGWQIDAVRTNRMFAPRVYLIDPALRVGTSDGTLPYTQTIAGSIKPVSPRIIIICSLFAPRGLPVSSGVAQNTNTFNGIWNTLKDTVPTNWPAAWNARGKDLKIQRIDLSSLFRHLVLTNFDSPSAGIYSIDSQATNSVPSQGIDAYFVDGTILGFHDENGNLFARQLLQADKKFLYERSLWRGEVFERNRIKDLDLEKAAFFFGGYPWNPNAKGNPPVTQAVVTNAMITYMNAYCTWAQDGFPTHPQASTYNAVKGAQVQLENLSNDLLFKPGL